MHRDYNALQRRTNAKYATNTATFQVYAIKRRTQVHHKSSCRNLKAHQLHAGLMYVQDSSNCSHSEDSSSDESFCQQLQIQSNHAEGKQIPNPIHLIMNHAYQLTLHHTINMYLQTQLDTCADVNIMLASVYQLVLKDLEMRKIKPYKMQISTYVTRCTGMLDELVGSHTKVVIYPTYAICCKRL